MLNFRALFVLALAGLVAGFALQPRDSDAVIAPHLSGTVVRVIDGDTLDLGGERVRLFGIDAPETGQPCDRQGQVWDCGAFARRVLQELVAQASVTCAIEDRDRYGRAVATCRADGRDINAAMVKQGAALAYTRYSDRYTGAEAAARAAGRGLWAGRMVTPEAHRHQDSESDCPEDRPIKGNISGNRRIYHSPGQADYARTRINPAKGEQCFATADAAKAAGFRPARR